MTKQIKECWLYYLKLIGVLVTAVHLVGAGNLFDAEWLAASGSILIVMIIMLLAWWNRRRV
jgi:hypothetical protein